MLELEEMRERLNKNFVSRGTFKEEIAKEAKKDISEAVQAVNYNSHTGKYEKTTILNIPAAFDIETTQVKEKEVSYMYIWMLCVNGISTYGRTWDEFSDMMNFLESVYDLKTRKNLIIYVHNLGFEMSFMMPRYAEIFKNVFALDKHEPVKIQFSNIIFKDSLKLSGMSLQKTAENMTMFDIKKMSGDLDYSKMRNSLTPLTNKEMGYCLHDVTTLTAYIYEQIIQYGNITLIPLTNTGRVRDYAREHCLYTTTKKGKKVRNKKYCELIKSLTMTPELYDMAKQCFTGGFTHAGHNNADKVCKEVHSMDFTSSYPAVLCSEKFPMSQPELVKYNSWEQYFQDVNNGYGVMMVVDFEDISDVKFPYEHYISESKCVAVGKPYTDKKGRVHFKNTENTILDNGRVVESDHIRMVLTELDLKTIMQTYSCKHCHILRAYRYKMDYLPKEFISCVLGLYEDKTTLKDVEGKEAEYQLKKGMLNSLYGMIVTDIVNSDISWSKISGWFETEPYVDYAIQKYNKSNKRFTYYLWGVYVTAYARAQNLWSGIQELKEDYCYSDTDSVKFFNKDKHEKYFQNYNGNVTKKIQHVCDMYGIDRSKACPKTVKGENKPLGVWDYEGYYKEFKTLGAKRYIIRGFNKPDGTPKAESMITIAGVNKKAGNEYIFGQKDPFKFFNEGMYIDPDHSGKTAVKYAEMSYGGYIIDDYGNIDYMYEEGGAYVYETDYHMSIPAEYSEYLSGYTDGINIGKKVRDRERVRKYLTDKK